MVDTRSAVPCDVLDGDADLAAGRPLDRAVGERAEPDLGALQVGQDGDGVAGAVGGLPDQLVGGRVVGVRAVAEVQPGDVHPGLDEGGDLLRGAGRGPEGADDLGAAGHGAQRYAGGRSDRPRPRRPDRRPTRRATATSSGPRPGLPSQRSGDRGRGDRAGAASSRRSARRRRPRRRRGPRRSPRRSATARGPCRRRRRRRARWT